MVRKLSRLFGNFLHYLETFQTIWKLSKCSGNFLDHHLETFQTICKFSRHCLEMTGIQRVDSTVTCKNTVIIPNTITIIAIIIVRKVPTEFLHHQSSAIAVSPPLIDPDEENFSSRSSDSNISTIVRIQFLWVRNKK